MWFLTQHKRWGLLKEHPDYLAVAKQINQIDLYKQVATAMKVPRAQGRDANQQADGRRGLGRQGPEEIRRRFQDQGLSPSENTMVSAVFHGPFERLPADYRARPSRQRIKLLKPYSYSATTPTLGIMQNAEKPTNIKAAPAPGIDWRGQIPRLLGWRCCPR